VLKGRVVDQQGQPVADADVSTFWSANGVTIAQAAKSPKDQGDVSIFEINEGRMEPWGSKPVKTDAQGKFALQMGWRDIHAFALDKERKLGTVYIRESIETPNEVEIKLAPLVRVHGTICVPRATQKPEWTLAVVRVRENEQFPLLAARMAICSSRQGYFEFLLPPGQYELESAAEVKGIRYEHVPFKPITVPKGQTEYNCGLLELVIPPPTTRDLIDAAKANGTFGDVDPSKLNGQLAPTWYAVESRRLAPRAQVSDFRGKWLLLYFWGPSCAPCLGKTFPELMTFYEQHAAQRDQFEIVAICIDADVDSLSEVERRLQPVVRSIWKKELPFPVVFDNTLTTAKRFGQDALGDMMLIDPNGILLKGDHSTLAEKLANPAVRKSE
jgi:hypothetical protein